jgi:[protein-PII] uridylyltransferase
MNAPPPPLIDLKHQLKAQAAALDQRFWTGENLATLLHIRTAQVDAALIQVWEATLGTTTDLLTLLAVGGYGRRELLPKSDIDILILCGSEEKATLYQAPIAAFITALWDIGLHVGHSVRTLNECRREAARDITVYTSALEARQLHGNSTLAGQLENLLSSNALWPPAIFFAAKWEEQRARHRKYDDTAYNLEPNIKEGPGGLRDAQIILWIARRQFGSRTELADLVPLGLLTASELQGLRQTQDSLFQLRYALHALTGRREDRLLFDYQCTLAQRFGYQDREASLAVEQFMQNYYRVACFLGHLNELLLQLFQETLLSPDVPASREPLDADFVQINGYIAAARDDLFSRNPLALLALFTTLQAHPELQGIRAVTLRQAREQAHLINAQFRANPRARELFLRLLRQHGGLAQELRQMHALGILGAYWPAFAQVTGQMQYDLFHIYTVDEHTLFVVRNLRRIALPEYSHELPLASALMQQQTKPELLYLAGLFHDIAKGRGGDHSELGENDALSFCRAHGLPEIEGQLVAWLVRHHLLMSSVAQRKDISDPDVVRDFASRVGDSQHLEMLYILTTADIRATNPKLWNGWRDALLKELYFATRNFLQATRPALDQQSREQDSRQAARILLGHHIDAQQLNLLWEYLGAEYFRRYSPEEIAWHTRERALRPAGRDPLVLLRHFPERGGSELFIHAPQQDLLFASITALIDQAGLTIANARIITAADGRTLDSFLVFEASGEPLSTQRETEVMQFIRARLQPPYPFPLVSRRVARQLQHFTIPTEINFSNDTNNHYTIMELITTDYPGILSRVSQAFATCGVLLREAKIATLGARAEDVFFITDLQQHPLSSPEQFQHLRQTVQARLAELRP